MSNINPNNINGSYPIAGQDNDSQGFRDNFTNIKNNLTTAETELTDLQNNALVKVALQGTTINNEMNNAVISGPQLIRVSETMTSNLGVTGATTISFAQGHFQVLTMTGNVALTFTNWAPSGYYAKMRLWINPSVNTTLTFPAAVTAVSTNVANIASLVVTYGGISSHMYEVSSFDNGINFGLTQLI